MRDAELLPDAKYEIKYHLNLSVYEYLYALHVWIIPINYLSIFIMIKVIRLKQQTQILNDLNVFIFSTFLMISIYFLFRDVFQMSRKSFISIR